MYSIYASPKGTTPSRGWNRFDNISLIERATAGELSTVVHFAIMRMPVTAHFVGQVSWNLSLVGS